MSKIVSKLRGVVDTVIQGGGEKAIKRHLSRGKLLPRDRVDKLLDPGYDVKHLKLT